MTEVFRHRQNCKGFPACHNTVVGRNWCPDCRPKKRDSRPSSRDRGYGDEWPRIAAEKLQRDPNCEHCLTLGRTIPASTGSRRGIADHIIPKRVFAEGRESNLVLNIIGAELFTMLMQDPNHKVNLMSMAHDCHTRKTQYEWDRLADHAQLVRKRWEESEW